jgi:hypothetical protein
METVEAVYQMLEPMNFSKAFLEKVANVYPAAISVLPVSQVFWSDLGSPRRIAQVREILEQSAARNTELKLKPAPAREKAPKLPGHGLAWRRALA